MQFEEIKFSRHALTRMFEQKLSIETVEQIAINGEIIKTYSDDQPFPSYLCLRYDGVNAVHVVAAIDDKTNTCIIVTAYIPDASVWSKDFKTKLIKL